MLSSALPLVLEEPPPEHPFLQSEVEASPKRGRQGSASVKRNSCKTPRLKDVEEEINGALKSLICTILLLSCALEKRQGKAQKPHVLQTDPTAEGKELLTRRPCSSRDHSSTRK